MSCPLCHTPWTKNVSQSEKNPNRVYNSCKNCFQEKPGEFWCWDGEEPKAFKIQKVKEAKAAREGKGGNPPPAKKRKWDGEEEVPSPPLVPRSVVDIIQDKHCDQIKQLEEQNREILEILKRIETTLNKEFQ